MCVYGRQEAFQAVVVAFEEQSWAAEVSRIARSIAAIGSSHRGALTVIKHLSPHDPRISQLRQQAAAALLSSLDFCQVGPPMCLTMKKGCPLEAAHIRLFSLLLACIFSAHLTYLLLFYAE